MMRLAARFRNDDRGATVIEYALIAGFLSIAIVVIVGEIGTEVNTLFTSAANAFR